MSEYNPTPMEQRAIDLAERVMAERREKNQQKFPPESTREEVIAAALRPARPADQDPEPRHGEGWP